MSLRNKTSNLQNPGPSKRPGDFEFGPDSKLHNVSSTFGSPAFSTYKSAYLRTERPVNPKMLFPQNPKKYLDNLPR
jgi:hypothetical protein